MYTRVIPSLGALGFFFCALSAYADGVQCNKSAAEIAEEHKTTVVSVEEDSKDINGTTEQGWIGAGVFLDTSGSLLSAGHLAYDGDDQKRNLNLDEETYRSVDELDMLWDGSNQTTYTYWAVIKNRAYPMELVGTFRYADAALFKVDLSHFEGKIVPAKLGNSDALKQGDPVFMIGNPNGIEYSITAGIVSGLHRQSQVGLWYLEDFIQTDALIAGGDSGGALINACGEVVGINDATEAGFGFVTPINLLRDFIPRMRKEGNVKCGWFGAEVLRTNFVRKDTFSDDLTTLHTLSGYEKKDQLLKLLALTEKQSALITKIADDSPAKKAGLRQGDIVTEFNGTKIESGYDFRLALTKTKVGEEIMVQVTRVDKHGNERPIVYKIKLGNRKTVPHE